MACSLPDEEDILANPLAHPYSKEVNKALQPHISIFVALMEWKPGQDTHLSPESVPVLALIEAQRQSPIQAVCKGVVSFVGDLDIASRAQVHN